MHTISTYPGKEVKLKPKNVPAPFNSAGPLCTPSPAVKPDKPAQAQDLQKSGPGARAGSDLPLDIPVLLGERKGKQTSQFDRFILGTIASLLHGHFSGYIAEDTIAYAARCFRSRVSRSIQRLKAVGYLDVDDTDKCNRYYIPDWVKRLLKTWVNPLLVRDYGLSIGDAVNLSDLKFRQGDNDCTWATIQERADVLGVSYHTLARSDASLATRGFIQKVHRPWKESLKNKYRLTCLGREATGVFEPKTARPKQGALGQTIEEGDCFKANKVRNGSFRAQFGLSFSPDQDQKPYELLVCIGVNRFVARLVAAQHRKDPKSVENMIWNWTGKTERSRRYWQGKNLPAPRIPLAGYVVGGLNIGIAECHSIKLSSAGREAKTRDKGGARAAAAGQPPEAELKKLEQYAENVLKPCLAKHPTPDKSVISTQKPQSHDKKTGEQFLTATLAAARKRDYGYRRLANSGQKVGFCLDKVS
jgi:sRNA-binding protein